MPQTNTAQPATKAKEIVAPETDSEQTAAPVKPAEPISPEKLAKAAVKILKENDRGLYTMPAADLYPHQWLWDSCFIAIGLRHLDVERAKMELTSLCRGQWHNGMLPNIIFRDENHYRRDRNTWRSWISPESPDNVATSGITQPPLLAEAVVRVGEKLPLIERRSWYKLMWPTLINYHQWIYNERDPHSEGLALLIHPWEVGMDNTPPWISELHQHLLPGWIRFIKKTRLDTIISLFRRDTRSVPLDERFNTIEALALFDVQRRLKRKHYDINRILDHSLFAIEDLTFNCILVRANENLRKIAKTLREQIPSPLAASMKKTESELEKLWDPYTNQYYSRDFITHNLIKEPSIAALMPLYAGTISKERAAILVRMLENENEFGPTYPVPTVPISSQWFSPRHYWQGPSWINTNWLIIDGLRRYGFSEHADTLQETTLEMAAKSGFPEYFDPVTGERLGAHDFAWTAALTIDLLKQ